MDAVDLGVNLFVALFALVDPIGNIPIFAAATAGASMRQRLSVSALICIFIVIFLCFFFFTGLGLLQFFGIQIKLGGAVFTLGVIFMVLLVIFLWYVLNYTAWGRRLYAVGDDPDAADLAGVPVKRMLLTTYTLSGLICGMAGWVLIGRIGSVSPTAGEFANIESVTAVVIGGISLFGGRGSILGMIFGALIVGVFSLGLRLYGADAQWTYLLIGVLIIGAVAVDQWIRKVAA